MTKDRDQEIVSLNNELYADFSIQELEGRLELEACCWLECQEWLCGAVCLRFLTA